MEKIASPEKCRKNEKKLCPHANEVESENFSSCFFFASLVCGRNAKSKMMKKKMILGGILNI